MKLTVKQENFCNFYIETGNASDSYRRAYNCKTMSDKVLWVKACVMLAKDKVAVRVKELQDEQKSKSDITKERVLEELRCIAFADIRDFLSINEGVVKFKDSSDWSDEMARAVEGVKTNKDGIELKLNGKNWSIQRICKMLGFDTPTEISIKQMFAKIGTGTDE